MKKASIILVILGISLLTIGTLDTLRLISLEVVDTTPPNIYYTFPSENGVYTPNSINEYIAYCQDIETKVTTATYIDPYAGTITLNVTPYTQMQHPLIIQSSDGVPCKFPDINLDGYVDDTDKNILLNAFGTQEGDPNFNPACDLRVDGVIDEYDKIVFGVYYMTTTFKAISTFSYQPETVNFIFESLNQIGLSSTTSSTFTVEDYPLLEGTWTINDIVVSDNTQLILENNEITVKFNCTGNYDNMTVKANINNVDYELSKISNNIWSTKITLTDSLNTVTLNATGIINGITAKNYKMITLKINKVSYSILGISLMLSGIMCIVAGLIYEVKKQEIIYK